MRLAASPQGLRKLTRGRRRGGERGEEGSLRHKQEANKPRCLLIGKRITEETCIKVAVAAVLVWFKHKNFVLHFFLILFSTPLNSCQTVHNPQCVLGWVSTDTASNRFNILNGKCVLKSWRINQKHIHGKIFIETTSVFHGGTKREILRLAMLKYQYGREWREC